ncbi:MAG TPA: PQQ-dependent sugar dehydrogenase [Gemmatimonadaceae bacterium]|nr:PQQ-dependent sugar dehydrogenase [Gemmatimonadaceae bacterium]
MRVYIVAALAGSVVLAAPGLAQAGTQCAPDNAGLELPHGFCAALYADSVTGARHLWIAPNGDVFVSTGRGNHGIVALRDANGDGRADERVTIATGFNSSELREFDGYLYTENTTDVLRFPYTAGALEPAGAMDTVVKGLPKGGDHFYKTFIIDRDGSLYVNVGSADNACQEKNRAPRSKGKNPCDELETRAGIWKFDARKRDQTQAGAVHFARGIRNAVGMAISPFDGKLWVTQHGRDQLGGSAGGNWPFSDRYNAENPAEELLQPNQGDDFGWPYCYYAVDEHHLVLAPEYGGDGKAVGQCAQKKEPVAVFPAHWAPDGLMFYTGSAFPAKYRNGVFIAFHGSWNRAPEPQAGYRVVFQPLENGKAAGAYETFANGFAPNLSGRRPTGVHRPAGLAQGPDGALYVADDAGGRIYKIVYTGK